MNTIRPVKRNNIFVREFGKNKVLFLMIAPVFIYFIIFSYLPMVGVYYAFTNYNMKGGLFGSPFIGFKNFEFLFTSGTLLKITANTILYNLAFILTGNFAEIAMAIMLAEISSKVFKRISQTILLLPCFISFVLVAVFAYNILNVDNGVINTALTGLGLKPYSFYSEPSTWKYIFIFVNIWKGGGYGTIVYLAAIMNISNDYYEASKIDGATVFQQIRHITLPLLKPTFVLLLLFSLGGILRGQFDMFYQLVGNNGMLRDATDIIDTYVYRALTANFDLGMGTAAGLYQSFFGFFLVMLSNYAVKKLNPDYALF